MIALSLTVRVGSTGINLGSLVSQLFLFSEVSFGDSDPGQTLV